MTPTISVCLPVRNGEATLERFLASFRQCDAFDESHPVDGDHAVWRLIDEESS